MHVAVDLPAATLHTPKGYELMWTYLLAFGRRATSGQTDPDLAAFLSFCLLNGRRAKGQLMQDLYVLHKLPKSGGFFVDFGGTDGITINNTYLLETALQWQGIIAEPMPAWHQALQTNRHCNIDRRCVWSSSGETMEFLVPMDTPELSTLRDFRDADEHSALRRKNVAVIEVETISLNDLLLAHHCPRFFDYLSIDTEGSEYEILRSLDMDRWQPCLITVEHNHMEETRSQIKSLLNRHGYVREFEMCSKWDDWYYHPQLLKAAKQSPIRSHAL
jgi:FkbM family methyltransferase